jgi:hypothetical protein
MGTRRLRPDNVCVCVAPRSSPWFSSVDPFVFGSYGLLSIDLDQDGRTDLVSVAWTGGSVGWYRNMGIDRGDASGRVKWNILPIATCPHAVYAGFGDFDGDGLTDVAVASEFDFPPVDPTKEGQLDWFRQTNGAAGQTWEKHHIGNVQGLHRIAVADLDNDGRPEIVLVPLFGAGSPPLYGPSSIFVAAPADPTDPTKEWNLALVSQEFYGIHNAILVPKEAAQSPSGGAGVLLACQQGLILLRFGKDSSGKWSVTPVTLYSSSAPASGLMPWYHGATAVGFSTSPPFFIGAVDYLPDSYLDDPTQPWHGDTISVYTHNSTEIDDSLPALMQPGLTRKVLYLGRSGGHTVMTADLNRDGCVDMIVGYRGAFGKKMILFSSIPDPNSKGGCSANSFQQQILTERGTNMIALLDADLDGWTDVATVGWGDAGDPTIVLFLNKQGAWANGMANADSSVQDHTVPLRIALATTGAVLVGMAVFICWDRYRRRQVQKTQHRVNSQLHGINSASDREIALLENEQS